MLELPQDYFISRNQYDKRSEDWLRWMMHPPRSREYYDAVEAYQIGGHCDQSSLTLLFEQNVAGLQMLTADGTWKWVKSVPGGITINAGELFSHLTKGYVKATIHRVHAPVDDQINSERLGCIYFALMNVPTPPLEHHSDFLNTFLISGQHRYSFCAKPEASSSRFGHSRRIEST